MNNLHLTIDVRPIFDPGFVKDRRLCKAHSTDDISIFHTFFDCCTSFSTNVNGKFLTIRTSPTPHANLDTQKKFNILKTSNDT